MMSLNMFKISLREIVNDNYNFEEEDTKEFFLAHKKKLFEYMAKRATDYRINNTATIRAEEESRFEKKYLVMNKDNVVLCYFEKYQLVDEKLRNRPLQIFGEQIAETEVELEDIVIDIYSAKPIDNFKQKFYVNIINGLENNLE